MSNDSDTNLDPDQPEENNTNPSGQRFISTHGGDYAEGNIDKRQGTFVTGDVHIHNHQSRSPKPTLSLLAKYRHRVISETTYLNQLVLPMWQAHNAPQLTLSDGYIQLTIKSDERFNRRYSVNPLDLKVRLDPLDVVRLDPLDVVRQRQHVVILGPPGSGKSTLLQVIAHNIALTDTDPVPIRFSLRDFAFRYAQQNTSIRELALEQAAAGDTALRTALEQAPQKLWLLDGLDEAGGWRQEAIKQITRLDGWCVLTSRPFDYQPGMLVQPSPRGIKHTSAQPEYWHFEIQGFSDQDVTSFLEISLQTLARDRGYDNEWISKRLVWLQHQIAGIEFLRTQQYNPLTLSFLVSLFGTKQLAAFPQSHAELYCRYVEAVLNSWEVQRRPKVGPEGTPALTISGFQGDEAREVVRQGLRRIGWILQRYGDGRRKSSREQQAADLAEDLQMNRGFNFTVAHSTVVANAILKFWQEVGVIEEQGIGVDTYLTFRDATLQDFAVADVLQISWNSDPERTWRFIYPRLHHVAWREPLMLFIELLDADAQNDLIGRLVPPQSFLKMLASQLRQDGRKPSRFEWDLRRDFWLAITCVARVNSISHKRLHQQTIETVSDHLNWLSSDHEWHRILMSAIVLSIQLLFVFSFMYCLALISGPPSNRNSQSLIALVVMLMFILFSSLGFVLAAKIAPDQGILLRVSHPYILYILFPSRLWPLLMIPQPLIAQRRIDFMHLPPSLRATLLAFISDELDSDNEQRQVEAVLALDRFDYSSSRNLLDKALHHEAPQVRLAAIEVLVTFGEAGDVGAIRMALDDTHPVIQLTAVRSLQEIASEEALVALQGHIEDPRPYVRAAVTKALQEFCPDEEQNDAHIKSSDLYMILMTLYEFYQEENKSKHDWGIAMEFLAMIIDPDYQGTVSVNVNGQVITMPVDHYMPHAIRRELEKFGKAILEGDLDAINRYRRNTTSFGAALPDSFDRLLPLLDDPDPELRELAVMSLAQTDKTKALPVLRSILKGSKRDLQPAAAMALRMIGSAAREDLKACSLNKDSIIRRAALLGIVEVFEPIDAMPFLRRALRDSRAINRCSAAEHIERLASSVDDHKELLKVSRSLWWRLTDDDTVRQAAHRALRVTADRIAELEVEQYVKSKKADDL